MGDVTVKLNGGRITECMEGTPLGVLLPSRTAPDGLPYIAAMVNNDIASLSYPLTVNAEVRFLTRADPHGWRIFRRSAGFLAAKAVRDLYPDSELWVEHSFGPGVYCSLHRRGGPELTTTRSQARRIETRMRELVERNLPIHRRKVAFMDAVSELEKTGEHDKLNLLRYRNPPRIVIHTCEGFSDLAHGPLASSTGVIEPFRLVPYPPGFVVHLPEREQPSSLGRFHNQPQLFQIYREHKAWGRILGVNTVGRLNEIIAAGELDGFIQTAEALHEKKLAGIAELIARARGRFRVVLIAGPSAAGKTTFAKRLSTHLAVNGLRPVTLGTDDYFVGEDLNPVDVDGKLDYEHIEAVDLTLFNDHLLKLIQGREIKLPTFNFATKQREYRGNKARIEEDQVILIEGIHALNPLLTRRIPSAKKFKIYVSALTQLNLDTDNRISTTDNRLMRRLVRDRATRGYTALRTLQQWPSVRRGEKRWIFPFQKEADVAFNSALDYEMAILKPLVEPLLNEIKPSQAEYADARRLSGFLLNFLGAADRYVPHTSILREYIGGSSYRY